MPTDPVPMVFLPGCGGRSESGDGGKSATHHITGMAGTAGRTDGPCETGPERAGSGPVYGVNPCLQNGNGTVLQRYAVIRNEAGVDRLPDRRTVHTTKSTGRVNGACGMANRIADAAEHELCAIPIGDRHSRSDKKDFKMRDGSHTQNLTGMSRVSMPHYLQVGRSACMHRGATEAAGNDDKSSGSRHPKADDRSVGGGSRNQSSRKKEQNDGEKFDIRIRR